MTKEKYGRDCKVCLKPFTIFRWCPGPRMRFRSTEICNTCARLKNICQSCMLDLQFGLPVQVRDTVLGVQQKVPKNEANREYFLATNAERLARGDGSLLDYEAALGMDAAARATLAQLAPKRARSERNLAAPCSFYAKGRCTRGDTCPYRHVLVAERYPSLQSYRDRYYGENDPAAQRILEEHPHLAVPSVKSALSQKSFIIRGIRDSLTVAAVQSYCASFGPLLACTALADDVAAEITFRARRDADAFATKSLGDIDIEGISVHVIRASASKGPREATGGTKQEEVGGNEGRESDNEREEDSEGQEGNDEEQEDNNEQEGDANEERRDNEDQKDR